MKERSGNKLSQLKAGAVLSYLRIAISMIIALIYTPIMIRILGQSEFGLYSLIGSLAAYFSVMDMGLGNAMVRYTARNRVKGDNNRANKLNGMFLTFYSFVGVITIIVGVIVYQNINIIFENSLSQTELKSAKIMVLVLIVNFSLSFPLSIFNSLLKAYEKFMVEQIISIARIVLSPLIILPIIYLGHGAVSMVIITTIVNIGCLVYSAIYCLKRLNIKITFGKMEKGLVREILGYSFFVFIAVIVDQIYWQTDQIILGAVSGTLSVAVYAIAIQFIKLYMQFSTSISGLFLPKATMMVANDASNEDLTKLMIRYGRVQYLIITLILSGFILFGKTFIEYWAGLNYTNAYYIVLIIMIPLTIPLVQNFGISILYARNLQAFRSGVLIAIAVLNIIVSIPVAKVYGAIGVAYITAITLILGNIIIMNIYYHKKIGLNMLKFWNNIIKITVPIIITLLIGLFINYIIPNNTIPYFVVKVVSYTIIHSTLLYFIVFNQYEKNLITSTFKRVIDRLS